MGGHILFLGSPASFAMDALELGMSGGCAYFTFGTCVFSYNFISGETKIVQRLQPELGADGVHVWLRPQPTISPFEEIRRRFETKGEQINEEALNFQHICAWLLSIVVL